TSRHVRADRVVRWTRSLEERYAGFRRLPQTLYFEEHKTLSTDTPENQFFKHALQRTGRRFKKVKAYIVEKYEKNISQSFAVELNGIEKELDVLSSNPF